MDSANALQDSIPTIQAKRKRKIGKYIGSTVYIHHSAIDELSLSNQELVNQARFLVPAFHTYEVIKLQPKLKQVSFIASPDWNTSHEPIVGDSIKIDLKTKAVKIIPGRTKNKQVYHHKWMFVNDLYQGFNVEESKKRSLEWECLSSKITIDRKKIGNFDYWQTILKDLDKQRGIWNYAIPLPTSTNWERGVTWEQAKGIQSNLFDGTMDRTDKNYQPHPTQVSTTVHTYQKIFEMIKSEEPSYQSLKILDASSGKGLGTTLGRQMGFQIEDIEMYPPLSYQPMYRNYKEIKNTYDFIICNMVLNIIPQDHRDQVLRNLNLMLNPNGKLLIIVRDRKEIERQPSGIPFDETNCEYYFPSKRSYQKGFLKQELVSYIKDTLDNPVFTFKVERLKQLPNSIGAMVTKIN